MKKLTFDKIGSHPFLKSLLRLPSRIVSKLPWLINSNNKLGSWFGFFKKPKHYKYQKISKAIFIYFDSSKKEVGKNQNNIDTRPVASGGAGVGL